MKVAAIGATLLAVVVTNEHGVDGFSVRPTSHVGIVRSTGTLRPRTNLRYTYDDSSDMYLDTLSYFAAEQSSMATSSANAFLNSLSRVADDAAFVSSTFTLAENAVEGNPDVVQPVMASVTTLLEDTVGEDTIEVLEKAMLSLKTASASLSQAMEQSQQVFLESAEENADRVTRILDSFPASALAATTTTAAADVAGFVAAEQQLAMEALASSSTPLEQLAASPADSLGKVANNDLDLSTAMAQVDLQAKESISAQLADPISQLNVMESKSAAVAAISNTMEAGASVKDQALKLVADAPVSAAMESPVEAAVKQVNVAVEFTASDSVAVADSVKDIQLQVMESADKAVSQVNLVESVATTAPSAMSSSDLASKLSDLSYETFATSMDSEAVTRPIVEKAARIALQSSSGPSSSFKLSEAFASASDGLKAAFSSWGGAASDTTAFKANVAASSSTKVSPLLENLLATPANAVAETQAKVAETLLSTQAAVVESTSTLSISKLAGAVAGGIQGLGRIIMYLLNAIIDAFTDGGSSLDKVILGAERYVDGLVDGAITAVQNTIQGLSQMSLSEAIQSIVTVVLFITRVLYKILNAVVELATGQGLAMWGSDATYALQASAAQLGDSATAAATDLTSKSLAELTTLVGSFVEQAGQGMVTGASLAWELAESTTMIAQSF